MVHYIYSDKDIHIVLDKVEATRRDDKVLRIYMTGRQTFEIPADKAKDFLKQLNDFLREKNKK
jgi:hypothetical protein